MTARWILPGVLALFVLGVSGCGGSRGTVKVKGTVTLDEKPLPGATITFLPEDKSGKQAIGRSESDGTFYLTTFKTDDGAIPGEYKVIVAYSEGDKATQGIDPGKMDDKAKMAFFNKMSPGSRSDEDRKKKSKVVPEAYTDATKTPLKETVAAGGSTVELKLRSSAR